MRYYNQTFFITTLFETDSNYCRYKEVIYVYVKRIVMRCHYPPGFVTERFDCIYCVKLRHTDKRAEDKMASFKRAQLTNPSYFYVLLSCVNLFFYLSISQCLNLIPCTQ